jgi:hypothetical protein
MTTLLISMRCRPHFQHYHLYKHIAFHVILPKSLNCVSHNLLFHSIYSCKHRITVTWQANVAVVLQGFQSDYNKRYQFSLQWTYPILIIRLKQFRSVATHFKHIRIVRVSPHNAHWEQKWLKSKYLFLVNAQKVCIWDFEE